MGYKELDDIRSHLNHNKIKNEFINKIGTVDKALSPAERSRQITAFWESLREPSSENEDIEAIKDTVTVALDNWPDIVKSIKDFFDNAPMKCGYRGTKLFEQARSVFFKGEESKIETINRFVRDYKKIAFQPETDRNEWLDKFWDAADTIHDTFKEMRPGMSKDARFGEYFEKI